MVCRLPLLFVKRWPRARVAYAIYAVVFVILSQASMVFLDECFLTAVTRWCYGHEPARTVSNEWFTVRLAQAIFGMAPSRHVLSAALRSVVLATAAGVILSIVRSAVTPSSALAG